MHSPCPARPRLTTEASSDAIETCARYTALLDINTAQLIPWPTDNPLSPKACQTTRNDARTGARAAGRATRLSRWHRGLVHRRCGVWIVCSFSWYGNFCCGVQSFACTGQRCLFPPSFASIRIGGRMYSLHIPSAARFAYQVAPVQARP